MLKRDKADKPLLRVILRKCKKIGNLRLGSQGAKSTPIPSLTLPLKGRDLWV